MPCFFGKEEIPPKISNKHWHTILNSSTILEKNEFFREIIFTKNSWNWFHEKNNLLLIFFKILLCQVALLLTQKQNYFSTHKCVPTTHHFLVDPFLTIWEEFIIIIHTVHIPSEDFWPAVIHLLAKKMLCGPTTTYTGCCFKFHRSFGALMFTLIS